jgi:hypothetical protein
MGETSADIGDMGASGGPDEGSGGAAYPGPGGPYAPRGPGGVPRGTAPGGSGVPSIGPKILSLEVTRSSGAMPWDSRFGSSGEGPRTCWRIASGMNGWSLLQISTVGARLPG